MKLEELKKKMDEAHYIYDDTLATVLAVALELGRPLLIEGAAGVGKTEIAKVMAKALDRDLVRLQCYEGLDESKALYEWNYQKQLLSIQVNMGKQDADKLTRSLFSDEYLLERPLLKSIRSEKPVVLLIDEIDKADEEFEAFLLELLSEMQVSIPEVGTIDAKTIPFVVLTSNRARPLSEALRRRLLRGLDLYQIDTLVDLINLVSLRTGYSIGGFDADRIQGTQLCLGIGREGEPFEGIGRGPLNIACMPVIRDAIGGIGTPTSDHERTKMSVDTRHILAIINGYSGSEGLHEAATLTTELLQRYASAEDCQIWFFE